jgi:membrane protease YdiL (CAAX protease family)
MQLTNGITQARGAPSPLRTGVPWTAAPALVAAAAMLGGLAITGQLPSLLSAGMEMGQIPLLLLALLCSRELAHRGARWAAIGALGVGGIGLACLTVACVLSSLLRDHPDALSRGDWAAIVVPAAGLALGLLALLLLPLALLDRRLRERIARWLPLALDAPRHWLGLAALTWMITMPLAGLLVVPGKPLAQALLRGRPAAAPDPAWASLHALYGLGWMLLLCLVLCMVAAGWPQARDWRSALARLGLRQTSRRLVAIALVLAGVQWLGGLGYGFVLQQLSPPLPLPPPADTGLIATLVCSIASAVRAGVGEELLWRGLVQPRFGMALATLGFTATHAFSHSPEWLPWVLLGGIIYGLLRQRTTLVVPIVAHVAYDLIV